MSKNNNLESLHHSVSHVLMQTLENLYGAIPGVGPAIDGGFYHDFDCSHNITEEDLPKIEKEMKKIIKNNLKIEKKVMSINEGIELLRKKNYKYTQELAEDLKIKGEKELSFYEQGDFVNMCKGPHIQSTGEINPDGFKLTKVAGAYWKGSEKNKMIQRIYGVAFNTKEELEKYLEVVEEAKKRDHRKIGREMDLFHVDEKVGLGLPLWHPKGGMLWRLVEDFWYKEHLRGGYELVRTPHIGNRILWETSGHWGFYNESMYPPLEVGQTLKELQKGEKAKEPEEYLLKPMNCPFHIQIYKNSPKSYRDFPMRWAECGTVYRFEKKGELSGLTRVRGFTQDDAHIICRGDQVEDELKRVVDFILFIFKSFGFDINLINVYLSLRDPKNKEKYAGNDEGWNFTENILRKVATEKKLNFKEEEGEAAFYGPKLDFKLKDSLGREWQCSTLQFDFNLSERFDMTFVNNKGESERPYVLHRALFGSFERFLALLIENYAGAFPLWISPAQVKIIAVGAGHIDYCKKLADEFRGHDIRVEVDDHDETVGNKIRKAVAEKLPYILVVGDKEMGSNKLAVRDRGEKDTREISKEDFIKEIEEKIKNKQ